MLRAYLNYGLVAAVVVWAAIVGMMAYRLEESPWRWAFVALVCAGGVTVAGIFQIRKFVDGIATHETKGKARESENSCDVETGNSRSTG